MSFCITKDYNIPKNTLKFLYDGVTNEETLGFTHSFGGILSNSNYAWLVKKSRFLVINCKNGSRVGSWNFGNSLQDDTAIINAVEEIRRPNGKEPHLIISINCETKGGIICIFDYVGSKVIRAIKVVEQITNIHVIDREQDSFSLSGPLRNFDGVLAVGTVGGNVYIVDLCRQLCYEGFNSLEVRDELNPCPMHIVTSRSLRDLESYKNLALRNNSHLAIFLNVVHNKKTEHFVLKSPDGLDRLHVNKDEVLISALHYCPQLCSILVGFNFGAYQLWNLMNMELVYTSQICEDHIPIVKFAIQEPADDPRAFCYIWAVYSTDDLESNVIPLLVMFALCYETKDYHENYGILYQNFQNCTVRFQVELGFGNNQSVLKPLGGKCLRLDSIAFKNMNSNNEIYSNDGSEDAVSLCVTSWKAVCESGQYTYMSIFDLNQWYKAQMPNSSNSDDCSSYMITLCISDLVTREAENLMEILDLNLQHKTIQQFIGTQRLEEHYYPSSLSFETCCLLEEKIVNIQYQGVQRALLCQLQTSGPLCLIRPSETFQEIINLGLTPLFVESNSSPITSLNNQREVILNVALEQQMTSWLCKCASEWANGSFSSAGCSLDLLTSWAFRRAVTLKRKCDQLCIPLFDYSDEKLDTNTVRTLSICIRQIKNISFIFSFILSKLSSFLSNEGTLSELCENLQMVDVYFEVLQWFFNIGLLPERSTYSNNSSVEDKVDIPYPIKELEEFYTKTRSELMLAARKNFSSKTSVLFIDNLISFGCGGDRLESDWKTFGGDGFYPPRSLQALLRTYLLNGVDVSYKHSVIIYLLLDLAVILEAQYQRLVTHFVKFPAVFKVSNSLIRITQSFWNLDHGHFNTALEYLLDPMVNHQDLKNWHHKVVLKSLLIHGEYNLALLYMNVRKPPILDDEDVLCALSLYVSNNMLDEAFYLVKNSKNSSNSRRIIKHLFMECSKHGRLHSIIHRNLTNEEEALFLQYLDEVKHPEAADLKITYFMQRSHYIEAFKTYQACEDDPMKKGLLSRLNLKARDQIVHSYKKFLPSVSYRFIESCTSEPNAVLWKEVSRPDPMSVCVRKGNDKTEYKSSFILAALAKAKLTFNENIEKSSLFNATTEEIPFLRTPTAMPNRKRPSVQVIIPKMVMNEGGDENGPSPPKRSKLSFSFQSESNVDSNTSILNTPIIVRKDSRLKSSASNTKDLSSTPMSILKVRNSYQKDAPNVTLNVTIDSPYTSKVDERQSLITGRKSTRTSMVRFDVPSTSSEEPTSSSIIKSSEKVSDVNVINSSENNSMQISQGSTPKNNSDTEEVYYSPNSSLHNIEELPKDKSNDDKNDPNIDDNQGFSMKLLPAKPPVISKAERVKLVDYDCSSSSKEGTQSSGPGTPKGRRSYRKLSSDFTPVRSSPRLRRNSIERERAGSDQPITEPSVINLKEKSERSLSRKVLEANTFSRLSTSTSSKEKTETETYTEEVSSVIENNKTEITQRTVEVKNTSYSCMTIDSASGEGSENLDENEESQESDMEKLHEDLCHPENIEISVHNNRYQEQPADIASISLSSASIKNNQSDILIRERRSTDKPRISEEKILTHLASPLKPRRPLNQRALEANTTPNDGTTSTQTIQNTEQASKLVGENEHAQNLENNFTSSVETTPSNVAKKINYLDSSSVGTPDSFIDFLYNDLCKRERPIATHSNSEKEGETSSEKSSDILQEKTPVRVTRRSSRRLSQERTSNSDSIVSSQKKLMSKYPIVNEEEQTKSSTGVSIPVETEKQTEESNVLPTDDFPQEHKKSDDVISRSDQESSVNDQLTISSRIQTRSAEKNFKMNRASTKRLPLSRRVLENNALIRITSSYEPSTGQIENSDVNAEMIEIEDNEKNVEDEANVSLSDSLLDMIAFGKMPKEKELLEKCRKSVFTRTESENRSSELSTDVSEGILKSPHETMVNMSESIKESNDFIKKNMESTVFELSDAVMNEVILEPFRTEMDTFSELIDLRQENTTPSEKPSNVLEENTPVRVTRRLSRRLSQERTSDSDSTVCSQKKLLNEDPRVNENKQTRASAVSIIPLETEKQTEETNALASGDFPQEHKKPDDAILKSDQKSTATDQLKITLRAHTRSLEKDFKINRTLTKRLPLSRRVLENNALMRTTPDFAPSNTEEIENSDLDAEIIEIEGNEKNVKDEANVSLSDSLLDIIAFGKIPKEKELLEKCRKSVFTGTASENQSSELSADVSERNLKFSPETIVNAEDMVELIEESDDSVNENKENMESVVFEISDDVMNEAILEPSKIEVGTISDFVDLRQENTAPSVFERNITSINENSNESSAASSENSGPQVKIIDISSSDELEIKSVDSRNSNASESDDDDQLNLIYGGLDEHGDETENDVDLNQGILEGDSSTHAVIAQSTDEKSSYMGGDQKQKALSHSDPVSLDEKNDQNLLSKNENVENIKESKDLSMKNNQEKPIRRITRRLSKQLNDTGNESISIEPDDKIEESAEHKKTSNAQRGTPEPELPRAISARKRTRSVDIPSNSKIEETTENTSKISGILRAKRKLRSVSVDIASSVIAEKAKDETTEVDKTRKKKPSSLTGLDSIKKEVKSTKKSLKTIKEDFAEKYKTNRRITRKQSSVVEQSLDKIDLSIIEKQDPIELLDKPDFEGTPDTQEQKVYETSPTSIGSSSTSNRKRPVRRLSTASNASDDSNISNKSVPTRRKSSKAVSVSPSTPRTRRSLRSGTTDADSKSKGQAKVKTSELSDDSGESDVSGVSAKSKKSTSGDTNNSTKRKKKVASRTTILPKISEENLEVSTGSPAQNTRRGKKEIQK